MKLLHLDDIPCRRRAIRAWVKENAESIIERGLGFFPNEPMEIELWKALDDALQPAPGLAQYITSARGVFRFWYDSRCDWCGLIIFRRTKHIRVPFGRTVDEAAKIISGCRKYLLLRAWRELE